MQKQIMSSSVRRALIGGALISAAPAFCVADPVPRHGNFSQIQQVGSGNSATVVQNLPLDPVRKTFSDVSQLDGNSIADVIQGGRNTETRSYVDQSGGGRNVAQTRQGLEAGFEGGGTLDSVIRQSGVFGPNTASVDQAGGDVDAVRSTVVQEGGDNFAAVSQISRVLPTLEAKATQRGMGHAATVTQIATATTRRAGTLTAAITQSNDGDAAANGSTAEVLQTALERGMNAFATITQTGARNAGLIAQTGDGAINEATIEQTGDKAEGEIRQNAASDGQNQGTIVQNTGENGDGDGPLLKASIEQEAFAGGANVASVIQEGTAHTATTQQFSVGGVNKSNITQSNTGNTANVVQK